MSNAYTLKISDDQAREMPMVDLAFELLKSANTPFYYRDLMQEIAKIKGLSESQKMEVIAQLYTEINIDGRFACVGTNLWGLKRWYPVDKSEDNVTGAKRPRIINDEDDDDDLYAEEEEQYDEEIEYDAFETPDAFDGDAAETEDTEFYEDEEIEEEEIEAEPEVDGATEEFLDESVVEDLEDADDEDDEDEK
jgi:DNA-directed RNA polymerase subunit delta